MGRHKAGTYGSGTGDGVKHGRRETTTSYYPHTRYGVNMAGGVAGAEPPHKGGPNRPDRPNAGREERVARFPVLEIGL